MSELLTAIGIIAFCLVFAVYLPIIRKKRCTDIVEAQCVGMKTTMGIRTVYLEGMYDGQKRRFMLTRDMTHRYTVGEKVIIYVNPNQNTEFYCDKNKDHIFVLIVIVIATLFYGYTKIKGL